MRTVQDTFRAVIEGEFYPHRGAEQTRYMCWALAYAELCGCITLDEYVAARRAIGEYLAELGAGGRGVMSWALYYAELGPLPEAGWVYTTGRQLYLDWDNRPRREVTVDIQEILNKVIDAGFYWGPGGTGCSYMCNSLRQAVSEGAITHEEFDVVADAVGGYVVALGGEWGSALLGLLRQPAYRNHPVWDSPGAVNGDFTELYRNWANRPMP